jgi:hypothetical protein
MVLGKYTPGTMGRQLRHKTLNTISSLQWQTAEEPYTPYQEMAPPLQAEEEGPPTTKDLILRTIQDITSPPYD